MKDPYYQKRLRESRSKGRDRKNVRTLSQEIETASRMLVITIGCLFLIAIVSFMYLRGIQSGKGYQLQQLQEDYELLLKENRELQDRLNEIQSITNLNTSDELDDMIEPGDYSSSFVEDINDVASNVE